MGNLWRFLYKPKMDKHFPKKHPLPRKREGDTHPPHPSPVPRHLILPIPHGLTFFRFG